MIGHYPVPTAIVLFCFAAMFAYSAVAGLWAIWFPRAGRRVSLFDSLVVFALAGLALVLCFLGFRELGVL